MVCSVCACLHIKHLCILDKKKEAFCSGTHSPCDLFLPGVVLLWTQQCPEIALHDKPGFLGTKGIRSSSLIFVEEANMQRLVGFLLLQQTLLFDLQFGTFDSPTFLLSGNIFRAQRKNSHGPCEKAWLRAVVIPTSLSSHLIFSVLRLKSGILLMTSILCKLIRNVNSLIAR